jgi:hypothetical protein
VVDIELPQRRTLAAVLTLMSVAKHQVATCEPYGYPRRAVVTEQMHHSRYTEGAADDWNRVVVFAHGEPTPEFEVVRLAVIVERERHTTKQQYDRALHRCHLNRYEVAVKREYWKR